MGRSGVQVGEVLEGEALPGKKKFFPFTNPENQPSGRLKKKKKCVCVCVNFYLKNCEMR